MGSISSDVIIIGAGPAGVACAVQLKRYGIDCAVLEKGSIGGLLHNAGLIENYPGFPSGIKASKLIGLLHNHLENYDVCVVCDKVLSVDYHDGLFKVLCGGGGEYASNYLVIAAGTEHIVLENILVSENVSDRVFYSAGEIDTDLFRDVSIVGAGDAAFDYALQLSGIGCKVKIFNRSHIKKAIKTLVARAEEDSNINYYENFNLESISPDTDKSIISEFSENNKTHFIKSDCLIFAVGRKPSTIDFGKEYLDMENALTGNYVYKIGDYSNSIFRQVSIATGDGIKAAMMINMNIEQNRR